MHKQKTVLNPVLPWIGYVRVSSDEQAESGLSLESQESKIRHQIQARGFVIQAIISDPGFSAKSLERPGIRQVVSMIEAKSIGGVCIAKLDRITRNVGDLQKLVELFTENDVALLSCDGTADTSTAAGRMVMNLVATVAQWEREVICERTRDALHAKIARGEHCGNIRYGYRSEEGREVPDEHEQSVISRMKQLRSEQGWSHERIARTLNKAGIKTRSGGEWRHQYVYNVLNDGALKRRAA
jgi:site-specific DNA recombinase